MKEKKKISFVRVAIWFFGLVILGTILSRVTSSVLTPVVETKYVSPGEIEYSIISDAIVVGDKNIPIYVCADVMVEEIYVTEGENICIGDKLLRVNTDELKALYLNKKIERKDMKMLYWYASEDERTADELKISMADNALAKMKLLIDQEGIVYATSGGVIAEVRQSIGNKTSNDAAFIITEEAQDYTLKINITEEQKENVQIGDKAVVQCGKISTKSEVKTVYADNSNSQNYIVEIKVSGETFHMGDSVLVNITHTSEKYDFVVPISAVYSDVSSSYVLVLKEKETMLGTEMVASKVLIKVGASNTEYVGIKSDGLSDKDKIIINSNKHIDAGDVVREK
jgi:multidrug efflux pump subunit AcrA (membrane-fusion protein)